MEGILVAVFSLSSYRYLGDACTDLRVFFAWWYISAPDRSFPFFGGGASPPPQIRNFGYLTSVSRHWCTGVVFMQPGVKVNGAYCTDAVISKAVTGSVTFQLQLLSCN